jgi:methyl-accepting chemotaxis protein
MSLKSLAENLSIRNKLLAAFIVILALVAALGFTAVARLTTLSSTVQSLTEDSMVGLDELSAMREGLLRYRLAVARYITSGNISPEFDKAAEKALATYREHEAKYSPTVVASEEQKIYAEVRGGMQAYLDAAAPAVFLYRAGKPKEAWDLYVSNEGVTKGEAVDAALGRDIQYNKDVANGLTAQADKDYKSGYWVVVGLLAAVVFVATGIGYFLVRSIARPLVRAAEVLGQLARRDYDFVLRQAHRGDEIGALSRAMDALRGSLQDADRLAAEQEAAQAAKLRRQAAVEQHTQTFCDSISGFMASLAASTEALRKAATSMSTAADSVHEQAMITSTDAAKSSQDLTAVAAAIEELNSSVGEISRQLAEASQVAQQAAQRAETSQGTMQGLSEATARIGDVVHLISDIAGQTNLLALNATIEAARAGEAGKGFAVVAGEVKSLASQTSKATSEIASQIDNVRGATDGAVSAMADIGEIITRMNGVAAAISAAVEEQSSTTREIASNVHAVAAATAGAAQAMEHVVAEAKNAGGVSRDVLEGAANIGGEADRLRVQVDQFLATIREDPAGERPAA